MTGKSTSWLVDPLTLRVYRRPAGLRPAPGQTRLLDERGQEVWVDQASLTALELPPAGAREALQQLLGEHGGLANMADELPAEAVPGNLKPLLDAQTDVEFMTALGHLTGSRDLKALETSLNALEAHATEAKQRLARGELPALPEQFSEVAPEAHPRLLLLLALAQAQAETPAPASTPPTSSPPASSPVQVRVAAPNLDFSWENLSRGVSIAAPKDKS